MIRVGQWVEFRMLGVEQQTAIRKVVRVAIDGSGLTVEGSRILQPHQVKAVYDEQADGHLVEVQNGKQAV